MRLKKHKPYRCPQLRVKSWYEITWLAVKRQGKSSAKFGSMLLTLMAAILVNHQYPSCHMTTWDGNSSLLDDDSNDNDLSLSGSGNAIHIDDDDMSRGMWDISSMYYSICHQFEDHSITDSLNSDDIHHCSMNFDSFI